MTVKLREEHMIRRMAIALVALFALASLAHAQAPLATKSDANGNTITIQTLTDLGNGYVLISGTVTPAAGWAVMDNECATGLFYQLGDMIDYEDPMLSNGWYNSTLGVMESNTAYTVNAGSYFWNTTTFAVSPFITAQYTFTSGVE